MCTKSLQVFSSMCEVEFEGVEGRALLIRQEGKLHALSSKCTHYGAPLVKGCLGNGRIRCPWHGACFNINSGDIEDFPGLDSLQKFEVSDNIQIVAGPWGGVYQLEMISTTLRKRI